MDTKATKPKAHMNAHETVLHYFNRAADVLGIDESTRRLLTMAKREITVEVPVEMDDGRIETLVGYRVQHNNARVLARVELRQVLADKDGVGVYRDGLVRWDVVRDQDRHL